jgi:hypothetical protein
MGQDQILIFFYIAVFVHVFLLSYIILETFAYWKKKKVYLAIFFGLNELLMYILLVEVLKTLIDITVVIG